MSFDRNKMRPGLEGSSSSWWLFPEAANEGRFTRMYQSLSWFGSFY